jgi:hypothetical protein
MWKQRNRIPQNWQIPVLYALQREGHDMLSFFIESELAHPGG